MCWIEVVAGLHSYLSNLQSVRSSLSTKFTEKKLTIYNLNVLWSPNWLARIQSYTDILPNICTCSTKFTLMLDQMWQFIANFLGQHRWKSKSSTILTISVLIDRKLHLFNMNFFLENITVLYIHERTQQHAWEAHNSNGHKVLHFIMKPVLFFFF